MNAKKTLCAIVLATAIGLSCSCGPNNYDNKSTNMTTSSSYETNQDKKSVDKDSDYIYGTVQKEAGTIIYRESIMERSNGALFGNESIKIGNPTYAIQFNTDDGEVYYFQIGPSWDNKLDALSLAIKEGTRIRIEKSYFERDLYGHVGKIYDNEIEIIGQKTKD